MYDEFNLKSFLYLVQIEVSSICNSNCIMCYNSFKMKDRKINQVMSLELFKKIIDELTSYKTDEIVIRERNHFISLAKSCDDISGEEIKEMMKGKIILRIVGFGEPLLNKNIIEMINYTKNKDFYVEITTNGSLLDKDMAKNILKNETIDRINISIDSHIKSVYENIRKNLNYDKVMQNFENFITEAKKFNGEKPLINVACVDLNENKKDRVDFINFFKSKGIDVVVQEDIRINKNKPVNYLCSKLDHSLAILSDGDIIKCGFDNDSDTLIGNITKGTLKDAWLSKKNIDIMIKNKNGKLSEIPICQKICIGKVI